TAQAQEERLLSFIRRSQPLIPSIWTSRIFSFGVAILVSVSCPHQRRDDSNKDFESVIYVYRDAASGICSLKVNGLRLQQAARKPQVFRLINLGRYDPATGKWVKERWEGASAIRMQDIERSTHRSQTDQTLLALPRKVGLFWVEWAEDEREANSLAVYGPVLC